MKYSEFYIDTDIIDYNNVLVDFINIMKEKEISKKCQLYNQLKMF